MTIQDFSKHTGIPKATLRYYESVGILLPKRNDENSYRLYSMEQLSLAKLISSLRIANISIKEIRNYLKTDMVGQLQMKENWTLKLKEKKQILETSIRYLESDSIENYVFLIEKPSQNIVWTYMEAGQGKFGLHLLNKKRELEKLNIRVNHAYLQYTSGKKTVKAQIGFSLQDDVSLESLPEHFFISRMDASLCIGISFKGQFTNIEYGYHQLMNYANLNNWIPAGAILEWYRENTLSMVDIIMPVSKIGGET